MTRFSITMSGGPKEGESRLARILTKLTLEEPGLALDCRDQDTLALALPELLRRAMAEADRILREDSGHKE
ncbi:hypothetical protein A3H89_05285 [Candidatus Amesbacteria bacterium RIFCSPLOWO2_02_FULL_48_11]|uniref:Uncharacterized protein n=5 Tax=Candidatus Amesiibacteriota TaxID=1752730 RepID=A0A1F4Z4F1_9BACT|nr:MAG: hypothetical protein UX78_C0012G0015 [Candidatus Amesbacteria bacterium GW2011_GWA2_47_11]KKU92539.1 MAG: hypothetical protein UY22_C0034G0008 [Candidatus Amesbacteria bacterium GW2011_GWC1_48_10]KKU99668.1 MAG: hypothetical protein UY33_C0025G0007 [Candidatus Amesbacteria bacterium GW2011_GWA1_48_9]OGC97334.1 MAG: hypothetical protein A3C34_03085 [Candidatus Amesbacteria bacterium RIFCSPHIGHO2_02_FULL_48_21]OGD01028.1 MAG: hypothetical protein A3E17_00835 [Candidatus Amesbacteria bacte